MAFNDIVMRHLQGVHQSLYRTIEMRSALDPAVPAAVAEALLQLAGALEGAKDFHE